MGFFSIEGGLYKFMSTLFDILKLNFCWLLCSLPIVTIGASTVAAYTVTLKMVDDKEGYVAREFFKAFRANLLQGSILGVIAMIAVYGLWFNFANYQVFSDDLSVFMLVIGIIGAFIVTLALLYAFPLFARYENTITNTLHNSFRISLRFFGRTIILVAVIAVELAIIMFNYTTIFIGALIGPICIIYTISGFAVYVFRQVEQSNKEISE